MLKAADKLLKAPSRSELYYTSLSAEHSRILISNFDSAFGISSFLWKSSGGLSKLEDLPRVSCFWMLVKGGNFLLIVDPSIQESTLLWLKLVNLKFA